MFNDQKSKLLVITPRRPRTTPKLNVFLNNKLLKQSENLKYLGFILDKKFNFDNHVETITQNCSKLVHSLAKSVRISWGLNHEVMRII